MSGIATVTRDRQKVRELYAADWKMWFADEGDSRDGTADDPRIVLIGVDVHAAVSSKSNKPQADCALRAAQRLGDRRDAGDRRNAPARAASPVSRRARTAARTKARRPGRDGLTASAALATPLLAATLALTGASSLWGQPVPLRAADTVVRELVDENGHRLGDDSVVTWNVEARGRGRDGASTANVETLGPIVLRTEPCRSRATKPAGRSLVVIGWNVHVGGGDVEQLIDQLTVTKADGVPAPDYVLLLEEAYRAGG